MIVLRFPSPTHFRVRALEWGLAAIMVTIGVMLFDSYPTLDQPAFAPLREWGDDQFWGTVLLSVGGLRLIALWRNGGWVPSPWIRMITATASACIWALFTLGLSHQSPAFIVQSFLAWSVLADIYSAGRAASDARLSRDARMLKAEAPRILPVVE